MVSIHSRYTVVPSSPTPNEKLFSLCEQIKLRTHAPILFVYKPHNNNNSQTLIETLRNSLSQVLVIYYPLAGRLRWIKQDRWEIDSNAKGAQLLEAKCEQVRKLEDLGDFVPTNLVSQLIPNIDYDSLPIEQVPLLAVQLTRFHCGGFTIGVSICRAVIDGTPTMQFMSTWAKLARGARLHPGDFPCHDRTILDTRKLKKSSFLHSEFHAPPVWVGKELGDPMIVVVTIVKITKEQVAKLKKKASAIMETKPYSSFEVIAGHLWRCVSKARYEVGKNSEQLTRLSTLINSRNRLKPPLPSNYAGNAVFPTITKTCSFDELMKNPLSFAVENVREALERVTGEFVSSALDYIDKERDLNLLRYNFHYPVKGVCKGNSNFFVVSWMNFPFKNVDFGFGEPVYFGPGYMDSEGKAFVMNNGDGFVVAISLEASTMDGFRELFYDDMEEVFHNSKL